MIRQNEPDMEALYRAAVGPEKADYYVPKFLRFDEVGASKISWNWPSFFVAFWWGLYRRMYRNSLIYFLLIPFVLAFVLAVTLSILRIPTLAPVQPVVMLAYTYVLVPMYANSLYHRSILRRINEVRTRVPDQATQIAVLENSPYTSAIAWVLVPLFGTAIVGMLAAIAIPAYQTYTIRTQIAEGLTLSRSIEEAVAVAYSRNRTWPQEMTAVSSSLPVTGHYVADITVDNGTISIHYGNQANSLIADRVLSLRPAVAGNQIRWGCGYADVGGGDPGTGASGIGMTTIAKRFLPQVCRG
jgi:Pilin (bacterial filament)/Protein of unknown function (DUF2628)